MTLEEMNEIVDAVLEDMAVENEEAATKAYDDAVAEDEADKSQQ